MDIMNAYRIQIKLAAIVLLAAGFLFAEEHVTPHPGAAEHEADTQVLQNSPVFLPFVARPPLFEVIWPEEGSVVNVGSLVVVEIPPDLISAGFDNLEIQYSADGTVFTPITGPSPDRVGDYTVLWDANDLPSGNYQLRARLDSAAVATFTPIVNVRVNDQPVANAIAVVQTNLFHGSVDTSATNLVSTLAVTETLVSFDASESFDNDGMIVNYRWNLEDGTTLQGPIVQSLFPVPYSTALSLTVTDDLDGEVVGHYLLDLAENPEGEVLIEFREKDSCGCNKMEIKSTGDVDGPADLDFAPEVVTKIPAAEQKKLGPFNDGVAGEQLDLTKGPFDIFNRFEVIATLNDKSNPALCAEGQRVKRTSHRSGMDFIKNGNQTSDPRYDSTRDANDPYDPADDEAVTEAADCGFDDAAWCDDDYHGGGDANGNGRPEGPPNKDYKVYDGQERILWLDAPGTVKVTAAELALDGYFYKAKFEATVSGNTGTCNCSWEVLIEIDKDGKILNNKVQNVNCSI
jgi:hypothetical protein